MHVIGAAQDDLRPADGALLAPTAGPTTGAYTFTFSLFEVDIVKNSSRVLKEMGDIALPPELAAGYPAAHLPGDNKMYVILGNKDVTVSGHALYEIDMDNGNVTPSSRSRSTPQLRPQLEVGAPRDIVRLERSPGRTAGCAPLQALAPAEFG